MWSTKPGFWKTLVVDDNGNTVTVIDGHPGVDHAAIAKQIVDAVNGQSVEPALSKRSLQVTESFISSMARGGERTGAGNLTIQFIGEPPTFSLILLTETATNCGRGKTLLEAFDALLASTTRGADGQK